MQAPSDEDGARAGRRRGLDLLALVPRVYHLCYRMTLHPDEAGAACYQVFVEAAAELAANARSDGDAELEGRLLSVAARVLERLASPVPEVDFDQLDETLRSEATRTAELRPLSAPEREYLVWELKQGCMTAVVNCLAPGERIAFVLSVVLGLSDEEAARALGIREAAQKVRLSRAKTKVGDYLAPRCGHVDARNPCQCPSRIGVALRKGFIAQPTHTQISLRPTARTPEARRQREAVSIYATLPDPEPPPELLQRIKKFLSAEEAGESPSLS